MCVLGLLGIRHAPFPNLCGGEKGTCIVQEVDFFFSLDFATCMYMKPPYYAFLGLHRPPLFPNLISTPPNSTRDTNPNQTTTVRNMMNRKTTSVLALVVVAALAGAAHAGFANCRSNRVAGFDMYENVNVAIEVCMLSSQNIAQSRVTAHFGSSHALWDVRPVPLIASD